MKTSQPLRMTPQRRVILEQVKKGEGHQSADEIYRLVRQRLPRISLGTVYRNLEILCEAGLIKKLGPGGTQRRFEGNLKPHYHVRCLSCDRVEDAPVEPLFFGEEAFRETTEYEVLGHELEFLGLCPECRAREAGPRDKTKEDQDG